MAWTWPWQRKQSSTDILRELFGQAGAKSGVTVTWKTALEATTALGCARVIAEGLAQVPFKLYRDRADGGKDVAKDHALYTLLALKPNEFQTSYEFRETLGLHLVFCGNAFVFINRVNGRVVELLPFEPGQVTVKRQGWELSYEITTETGEKVPVPASDMWHLRGPSWNAWRGLDGVRLAREAIGLALATEEHGARMFSNGARVGGVLSTDATNLSEDQVKRLRESWEKMQGGSANAFKTAILWGGLKWQAMAMPNDQAQLIEQRKFQVEEICRAFRVMPIMVGYSDKAATYASAEQMFLAHVVHTMGPWYARLEQSAAVHLLSDQEREQGFYFKFVLNALLRGAARDRAEYYARLYGIGALSPNEIRALEDMNPYDDGDAYRVPLNMTDPASPEQGAPHGTP